MRLEDAIVSARQSRWLSQQTQTFQIALCANMSLRTLKKNENLFQVETGPRKCSF